MPSSGSADQRRPDFGDVLVDPGQRPLADRDHAVLLALAHADHHRAALHVEVVELQAGEFQPPDAGGVEGFQDGPVADAQRVGDVGLVEHAVGFAGRQHVLGQAFLHLGHVEFAGRVVEGVVLLAHHLKKARTGTRWANWLPKVSGWPFSLR